MDDVFGAILAGLIITLATLGGIHLAMDFRHFDQVVAQCEKQGYIQNETVRVMCTKEKRNADDR